MSSRQDAILKNGDFDSIFRLILDSNIKFYHLQVREVVLLVLLHAYWITTCESFSVSKKVEADIRMALLSEKSVQFCGARLATAVAIVCQGRYNTLSKYDI